MEGTYHFNAYVILRKFKVSEDVFIAQITAIYYRLSLSANPVLLARLRTHLSTVCNRCILLPQKRKSLTSTNMHFSNLVLVNKHPWCPVWWSQQQIVGPL